MSKLKTQQSFT